MFSFRIAALNSDRSSSLLSSSPPIRRSSFPRSSLFDVIHEERLRRSAKPHFAFHPGERDVSTLVNHPDIEGSKDSTNCVFIQTDACKQFNGRTIQVFGRLVDIV